MPSPLFGAVFDWDGVICDSGALHHRSWVLLAAEIDQPFSDERFATSFGMRNVNIIPEVLDWSQDPAEIRRLSDRKEELYRDLLRASGIVPLPGVEPFLAALAEAGVPCVVGSSTERANIACALEVLGLQAYFQDYVCGDDVSQGKPHPEVFLTGAARIGVPPSRCVVFEDAHVGIAAARAGGMRVVGVASTHPAAALTAADRVVARLDELRVAELAAWFPA